MRKRERGERVRKIEPKKLKVDIVNLWNKQWFLLTAGTIDNYNMMTVSWGSIGCMWNKPFAQIVVRPQRYTFEYLEKNDSFTLCAFPEAYRPALNLLGSKSGRHGDKLSYTDLKVKKSTKVTAPSYKEANLILECRKIYYQDLNPEGFIDKSIQDNYPLNDYHRVYYGEILAAFVDE
jgi:flavin reductase (DIM6/NTAB) family NADH-FMN oxidoreductase RutF